MRISPNWYYNWTLFVIYNPRCAANVGVVFTVRLCKTSQAQVFSKLKNSVLKGLMELNFQVLISYKLK